jgi:uncharacterized protein (DUF342 family)
MDSLNEFDQFVKEVTSGLEVKVNEKNDSLKDEMQKKENEMAFLQQDIQKIVKEFIKEENDPKFFQVDI